MALVDKRKTLLYAPTGAGKTEMGIALAKKVHEQGGRVLWTANRIELIEQTSRRFTRADLDHGIIQANHFLTDPTKGIQIASIQTITRRQKMGEFDLILIDEAHGATSPSYRKLLETYADTPVIGLSATPFSKGLGSKGLFERIVKVVTVADLMQQGFLCDYRIFAPSKPDLKNVRMRMGDYDEQQLAAVVNTNKLVGDIVHEWKTRANGVRTLVFATSIEHSKNIVAQFIANGVTAEHIDAYTPPEDRKAILERLKDGTTTIVSNVALLAEGFDLPDLGCMILARPTKSLIRYIQMIGRVLRPAEGKEYALVLDHSGTVEQLGFPDDELPLELDDGTRRVTQKQQPKEKLPKVCPKCAFIRPQGVKGCPSCGWQPGAFRNDPEKYDGNLVEIKRPNVTREERQQIYSAFVGHAEKKGFKPGWAAHQFHEMFRVWPEGLERKPGPMVEMAEKHIVYTNIKKAHAKKKVAKEQMKCWKCNSPNIMFENIGGMTKAFCTSCKSDWFLSNKRAA